MDLATIQFAGDDKGPSDIFRKLSIDDFKCERLNMSSHFNENVRMLEPRSPGNEDIIHRPQQSRSPSLRSSGRNVWLWDNPLPEARNPG